MQNLKLPRERPQVRHRRSRVSDFNRTSGGDGYMMNFNVPIKPISYQDAIYAGALPALVLAGRYGMLLCNGPGIEDIGRGSVICELLQSFSVPLLLIAPTWPRLKPLWDSSSAGVAFAFSKFCPPAIDDGGLRQPRTAMWTSTCRIRN